jgi:LPS-assembly protein
MPDSDMSPRFEKVRNRVNHRTSINTARRRQSLGLSALFLASVFATPAVAQIGDVSRTDADLKLAADSPFRDPDIIYLEADTLINDDVSQTLTAEGQVEGRYQDRTLRADRVIYNLETGAVFAEGSVVLVQSDGTSQYADKLELSDALEAGTATGFTARTADGGVTGARFVARGADGEVELYNAYYTACEVCAEDPNPSWRLKARRVTQDKKTRTVQYRDATLEMFGIPIFYTPYLAHPDPSADRASGFLMPFGGLSNSKGLNVEVPYYWAVDDYTEATFTPHVYTKVNPLLELQVGRRFATGFIDIEGSFTYGSIFDRNGNAFNDPAQFTNPDGAPLDKDWRGHINAKGLFTPNDFWTYGFGVQLTSDDNYLNRYDLNENSNTQGLYEPISRQNTSQAFLIGQGDDTRLTVSTVRYQARLDRIIENGDGTFTLREFDDGLLPELAPRIEVEHYETDPLLGGRFQLSGDFTALTRESGSDYLRAVGKAEYAKTWIAPGGVEVKPFANARFDVFELDASDIDETLESNSFSRNLGQVGVDIRYPFIKTQGKGTFVFEPRVQVTQSVGDAKLDEFTVESGGRVLNLSEDGGNADLDPGLLWQTNKASGFDFWQKGLRADVGASLNLNYGTDGFAELFLGQSFALDTDGEAVDNLSGVDGSYLLGSGLSGEQSDILGQVNWKLGSTFSGRTRVRYNEQLEDFTRIDSQLAMKTKWVTAAARYYRLRSAAQLVTLDPDAPLEEISGKVNFRVDKNWTASYAAFRDLDSDVTRRQQATLQYRDDCLIIELGYARRSFNNDAIRDSNDVSIRFSLLTLGEFGER